MEEARLEALEQALAGVFIQLARIYDALIVSIPNEEKRDQLLEIHDKGGLLTGVPWMNKETYEEFSGESEDEQ